MSTSDPGPDLAPHAEQTATVATAPPEARERHRELSEQVDDARWRIESGLDGAESSSYLTTKVTCLAQFARQIKNGCSEVTTLSFREL